MSIQHYQSIFGSAATEARQFTSLFAIFLVVCAIMYLAVIAFLLTADTVAWPTAGDALA